jgi:hypothetical protein
MDSLVLTLILAVIVMALVIAGLGIGLILTGKSRLRRGCGLIPGKKNGNDTCPMCGDKKVCDKQDDEPNNDRNPD